MLTESLERRLAGCGPNIPMAFQDSTVLLGSQELIQSMVGWEARLASIFQVRIARIAHLSVLFNDNSIHHTVRRFV